MGKAQSTLKTIREARFGTPTINYGANLPVDSVNLGGSRMSLRASRKASTPELTAKVNVLGWESYDNQIFLRIEILKVDIDTSSAPSKIYKTYPQFYELYTKLKIKYPKYEFKALDLTAFDHRNIINNESPRFEELQQFIQYVASNNRLLEDEEVLSFFKRENDGLLIHKIHMDKLKLQKEQQEQSAIKIQKVYRGYIHRSRYKKQYEK